MSKFDPDAFIKEHEVKEEEKPAFDPDAYLAEHSPKGGSPEIELGKLLMAGGAGLVLGGATGPGVKSIMESKGLLRPSKSAKTGPTKAFKTPTQVTEVAIGKRTPKVTAGAAGTPSAVENYGKSQFVDSQGKGLFYGAGETGDYAGARKAAEEAITAEKRFPGMKVIEGGATPLAVPESVAEAIADENKAKALSQSMESQAKALAQQKEIDELGRLRTERLAKVQKPVFGRELFANLKNAPVKTVVSNAGEMLNRMVSPTGLSTAGSRLFGALGGLDVGLQGYDAANRGSEGQYGRALVSGLGALGGLGAMSRHPIVMPIGLAATTAAPFLNMYLDKKSKEHPELFKKLGLAQGGSVQQQITPEQMAQLRAMLLSMKS